MPIADEIGLIAYPPVITPVAAEKFLYSTNEDRAACISLFGIL